MEFEFNVEGLGVSMRTPFSASVPSTTSFHAGSRGGESHLTKVFETLFAHSTRFLFFPKQSLKPAFCTMTLYPGCR